MQNDLISRSALIEALREKDKKYSVSVPGFMIAMRVIENQPTAYDVDKVMEQLKDNSKIYCEEYHQREGSLYIQDAVEIVRNGGKE